jgi:Kef-type K+ transport system membrane component KefB
LQAFSENQLLGAFLAILVVLLAARGTAEVSRRLKQPEVLGELLGGFVIGPSVLGAVFPHAFHVLFQNVAVSLALQWMSWIGAVLLLMIAGMEADLAILRQKVLPGLLAAAGAIGASIAVGSFLGARLFRLEPTSSFFLGLVLSVTAVSVVAKLLIEREALRRDYAQVLLAAGIAGEVLVWPLISIVSSVQHKGNPWMAGLRATGLAAGFFLFMFTLGRRFTYWAMRRVADATDVPNGELTLILVLMFASAAITTTLGLHPLLGAFVFGVLLGKAPRATIALKENIQAIAISLFAPIFFALAGMRVNLFNLRGWGSVEGILMLLVVASSAKVLFGFAGARLGGLPTWEAATVGMGLTLKGGTDVVVAIVGTELLLLSPDLYTTYAVVAILTVIVTPPLVNWLANKTAPGIEELKRLNREEARKLAYLADRERVLVPLSPELMPALSAKIVAIIATAKQLEGELFDVTEVAIQPERVIGPDTASEDEQQEGLQEASAMLAEAATMAVVEVGRIISPSDKVIETLEAAAGSQHLLAMGATKAFGESTLSFGQMQDRLLREISTDVLLTVHPDDDFPAPQRILVPITGLPHSYAAADIAAYLARGSNAEVVLLTVVAPKLGAHFWKVRKHRDLLQAGYTITHEATKRMSHLDVPLEEKVVLSDNPVEAIVSELKRGAYDLMVIGSILRSSSGGISLGSTVEHLLQVVNVPRVLLVSHNVEVATL